MNDSTASSRVAASTAPRARAMRSMRLGRPRALPGVDATRRAGDAGRCALKSSAIARDAVALDFNAVATAHATAHGATAISSRLTRDFGLGDAGTDVALAQGLLGTEAHGTCDARTTAAVEAFQASRGLAPSGYFGRAARAQVAREEEAWRALGGGELLKLLAAEAARGTETRGRAEGVSVRRGVAAPRAGVRVMYNAVWVFAALAISGAVVVTRWARRDGGAAASEARGAGIFKSLIAAGVAARLAGVVKIFENAYERACEAAIALYAKMAATTPDVKRPTFGQSDDATTDIDASTSTSSTTTSPSRISRSDLRVASDVFPRGARFNASARAEQMRARWANIRREPVRVEDNERAAIERVSNFLGGIDDTNTADPDVA
ncbi:hypothetical protein BE221DRAFT_194822 [Ostreococcus tauri]|uniref:Peptidoglycan binding-like n=1 Tax=Ostreococcus tauri TaxID=70448 RepID=A0A1Y5I5A5_OSTTA|nr:hypothetical protein BE221DRAFT_194822 [Ostreococcus tauri]